MSALTKRSVLKAKRFFRGFTLIELLIVITIIGILATFVVASFTTAQKKARDSRRKSDLDAYKKALELSKGDSSGGAFYPGCTGVPTLCLADSVLQPPLNPTYIATLPKDPTNPAVACATVDHGYCYNPASNASYTATTYTLKACLENTSEAIAGNTAAVANTVCTSLREYTVNNP